MDEIEAKFSIPDQTVYAQLQALHTLQDLEIFTDNTYTVTDEYIDTVDRRLMRAGYACRIRRKPDKAKLAIKSLGRTHGPIHYRTETEFPFPTDDTSTNTVSAPMQSHLQNLIGDAPLELLFTITQERQKRTMMRGERLLAELSLDTVQQTHADTTQRYQELEIEVKGRGTEQDLRHIMAHLCQMHTITPQSVSKFERGLAFISQYTNQALRDMAMPPAPQITPDNDISTAAYRVLHFHFQRMLENEAGCILGQDIEHVHDMRVATRRMRAVLVIFKPYLKKRVLKPYTRWIKRTARALGAVRDLDVFHENLQRDITNLPQLHNADLTLLHEAWETAYVSARAVLLAHLSLGDYATFKKAFAAHLREYEPPPGDTKGTTIRPSRVKDIAPILIYQRLAAMRAYTEWMSRPNVPLTGYHQLRIATKYLRYTLEFFQHALAPESQTAIEALKKLQTHLGELQDAVVTRERLHTLLQTGQWTSTKKSKAAPRYVPAITSYIEHQQEIVNEHLHTFPKLWDYYQSADFSTLLAQSISGLT